MTVKHNENEAYLSEIEAARAVALIGNGASRKKC